MTLKDQFSNMQSVFFNKDTFAEKLRFERKSGRSLPITGIINELDSESFSENEARSAEIELQKEANESLPEKYEKLWTSKGVCWEIEELLCSDEISWKVLAVRKLRPSL